MPTREDLRQRLTAAGIAFQELSTAGGAWALVAPELGAKVLGAGVDEENLLWVPARINRGDWCVGGVRTWLAPEIGPRAFFATAEQDWGVDPALDPGQYREIPPPNGVQTRADPTRGESSGALWFRSDLKARRTDGSTLELSLQRGIALEPVGAGVRLNMTHALVNREERVLEQEAGLWGIVQVPSEACGTILIPLTGDAGPAVLRPYFGALPEGWVRTVTDPAASAGQGAAHRVGTAGMVLCLKARAGVRYKVGVAPAHAAGALAYLRPSRLETRDPRRAQSTLVALRTTVGRAGRYLDGPPLAGGSDGNGDVLQCYNSPDVETLAFSELEAHAPAVRLQPGESQHANLELLLHKSRQDRLLAQLTDLGIAGVTEADLFAS